MLWFDDCTIASARVKIRKINKMSKNRKLISLIYLFCKKTPDIIGRNKMITLNYLD